MKISLIGMSGSGKSHWSRRLNYQGFRRVSLDELIQRRLEESSPSHRLRTIHDVATWMGFPYDARYRERSARYLALEEEALRNVLKRLEKVPDSENIVIDTTGSVVYLHPATLEKLKKATITVYLEIPPKDHEMLYRRFIQKPKPIIWGKEFSRKDGELPSESLNRCYPKLLAFRTKAYEALADHTLTYQARRRPGFSVESFISYLRRLER